MAAGAWSNVVDGLGCVIVVRLALTVLSTDGIITLSPLTRSRQATTRRNLLGEAGGGGGPEEEVFTSGDWRSKHNLLSRVAG